MTLSRLYQYLLGPKLYSLYSNSVGDTNVKVSYLAGYVFSRARFDFVTLTVIYQSQVSGKGSDKKKMSNPEVNITMVKKR